jgi:hypothetical protein
MADTVPPAPAAPAAEQTVDPWSVSAGADGKIDYDKLCREVRREREGGKGRGRTGGKVGPPPPLPDRLTHTHPHPCSQFGCSLIDAALVER